ncbi:MAG: ABC transporter substrate-binding protein, partial [Muribaculaceae bacterium]|nr:ABC transporter substrate-binding protein [Muribaculaceae bacterium]
DLALIYGVSTPSVMEPKLKQLNIPYVYIADYLEQSPLGRAEWLVALGYLTGREKEAIDQFSEIARRYKDLKASIDELPAGNRPKVMLNAPYNDVWYMPDRNSYMVTLITDAGGRYINDSNSTGTSVAVGDEEAFMMAQQSDIWLCPGSFATIKELTATLPRFASARPVKNGQVWNNTLQATSTGGNDFYESGSVNPDRILEDLIEIINPTDHDYQPYYFKQLR